MNRRRRWGGRGGTCPPSFGISVNPIRTKGGRLCPPYYYWAPHFLDNEASLQCKYGRAKEPQIEQTNKQRLAILEKKWLITILNLELLVPLRRTTEKTAAAASKAALSFPAWWKLFFPFRHLHPKINFLIGPRPANCQLQVNFVNFAHFLT